MGLGDREKKRDERARLLRRMEKMAGYRVNDAVKLAFLDSDRPEWIDGMDLTALTELKRSGNGAVEMKFINRLDALERLIGLCKELEDSRAEEFFRALNQSAESGGGCGV